MFQTLVGNVFQLWLEIATFYKLNMDPQLEIGSSTLRMHKIPFILHL